MKYFIDTALNYLASIASAGIFLGCTFWLAWQLFEKL